jgi:hypothetical protein
MIIMNSGDHRKVKEKLMLPFTYHHYKLLKKLKLYGGQILLKDIR